MVWNANGSGHTQPAPPRPSGPIGPIPAADVPFPASYRFPSDAPTIRAASWVLLDARTGRTLGYKNLDARRAVASTQKLLTALLVLERGNLDGNLTVQEADTKAEPSKMHLKAGQRYTRRQLLTVILVKSANDAALALARDHSGSIPAFAAAMNRKARQIGAYQSSFRNPHGLTEAGQFSTARDMAKIAFFAYRHPFIRDTVRRQKYSFTSPYGARSYNNTNKLLARMQGCNGMKTGFTQASGRCLISSASRNGRDVILVQLGTKNSYIWDDGDKLMSWGLARAAIY
jgi:D-alanyl-D-alanine carboxypeptidase (penicillin-binding protein 5/6)